MMNNEDKILSMLETMQTSINDLKQGQTKLEQGQAKLEQGQAKLEQDVQELKELKQDVRFVKDVMLRMEHDHGQMLKALSAGYQANYDLYECHDVKISDLENITERHDVEISALKMAK